MSDSYREKLTKLREQKKRLGYDIDGDKKMLDSYPSEYAAFAHVNDMRNEWAVSARKHDAILATPELLLLLIDRMDRVIELLEGRDANADGPKEVPEELG